MKGVQASICWKDMPCSVLVFILHLCLAVYDYALVRGSTLHMLNDSHHQYYYKIAILHHSYAQDQSLGSCINETITIIHSLISFLQVQWIRIPIYYVSPH